MSTTIATYQQCYESHGMEWINLDTLINVNASNQLSDLKATLSALKAACGWPNQKSLSIKHPGNFSPDQFDKPRGSTGIHNFSQLLKHEGSNESGPGSFIHIYRQRNALESRAFQKKIKQHKFTPMIVRMWKGWLNNNFLFRTSLTHVRINCCLQLGCHCRQ